jgi:toxin ParE1/3/4
MSDSWRIVYSEHAANDLRDIFEYIAFSLLEPGIAKKLTRRIIDAVSKLNQMPLRHHLYDKEPWRGRGLRVLPVGSYLVFYLPVESQKTVAIVRIMYGGRDDGEQLGQPDTNE